MVDKVKVTKVVVALAIPVSIVLPFLLRRKGYSTPSGDFSIDSLEVMADFTTETITTTIILTNNTGETLVDTLRNAGATTTAVEMSADAYDLGGNPTLPGIFLPTSQDDFSASRYSIGNLAPGRSVLIASNTQNDGRSPGWFNLHGIAEGVEGMAEVLFDYSLWNTTPKTHIIELLAYFKGKYSQDWSTWRPTDLRPLPPEDAL